MARCFQEGIHSLADSFLKYSFVSLGLEKMFRKCLSFKVSRIYYYHHLVLCLLYCTSHRISPSNSYIMTELIDLRLLLHLTKQIKKVILVHCSWNNFFQFHYS